MRTYPWAPKPECPQNKAVLLCCLFELGKACSRGPLLERGCSQPQTEGRPWLRSSLAPWPPVALRQHCWQEVWTTPPRSPSQPEAWRGCGAPFLGRGRLHGCAGVWNSRVFNFASFRILVCVFCCYSVCICFVSLLRLGMVWPRPAVVFSCSFT